MNQTEKVAKWLEEKHSFEPEDATEVAKDFLTLIGQQGEPVGTYTIGRHGYHFIPTQGVHPPAGTHALYLHPPASWERVKEVLRELYSWVKNWDPNFIYDDEWPNTRAKVDRILSEGSEG